MKTKIYALCEPDGKIRYIGKTILTLKKRFNAHLQDARNGKQGHRRHWIRSIISKGFLPFIQLIGEIEGDGNKEEIAWIKYFKDEGLSLVNDTFGGEGALGAKHTKEAKEKMSLWRKGRKHSEEWKKNISIAKTGKKLSPEHCNNMRIGRLKLHWRASAETRKRMSVERRQRIISPETRAKMKAALIQKYQNPAERKKRKVVAIRGWTTRKKRGNF